jgi:hypothetical protein
MNHDPVKPRAAGSRRHVHAPEKWRLAGVLAGLGALVWFLARVLPKPSRAAYPCQRVAAPAAAGFIGWCFWSLASLGVLRLLKMRLRGATGIAVVGTAALTGTFAVIVACGGGSESEPAQEPQAPTAEVYTPPDAPNTPMGEAKGLNPGRVVWAHDPDATSWNGSTGNWWSNDNTSQPAVDKMMSDSVKWLTGRATDAAAWSAIFRSFNKAHGRGDVGYAAGETISVKLNLNNSLTNDDVDNQIDASPHMVLALIKQLVDQAQIPAANITIYDASTVSEYNPARHIPDRIYDKCNAPYPGVHWVDGAGENGRTKSDWTVNAVKYSDAVPRDTLGGQNLSTAATSATYMINFALLKGHEGQGVTLTFKNHYGSIGHVNHKGTLGADAPQYNVFVDLMGHKDLGGKTVLYLIDGLYGSRLASGGPLKWAMSPFDGDWPSSLFMSQDPVAIDSVAWDFIHTEWATMPDLKYSDKYLHEAALAGNPPSGTVYDPEGDGTRIASLGVHEHWNTFWQKQYSRNLSASGTGIELVTAFVPSANDGGDQDGAVGADAAPSEASATDAAAEASDAALSEASATDAAAEVSGDSAAATD